VALAVYNTLSKTKEKFTPLQEGKVSMYVCGPTVYDYLHIGNFRGAIFFNLVRNWLEKSGMKVTYVYNYTDVDDKIIKRANTDKVDSSEISEKYIKAFEEDYNRLNLRPHSHNPSIDNFSEYGDLSGKVLEDLEAGQRVEVDKRKKNPFDFVLWKPAKEGEPFWDSPWGKGRPGWHIECSAMIKALLGNSIDIHGGGIDLIFPHHENEIAQGQGCSGEKYCNYWMHNNFINFKDEKMSKSLGNVITARSFMDTYHPEILKHSMLSAHYRSHLNINSERIEQSIAALTRIYKAKLVAENFLEVSKTSGGKTYKAIAQAMETADARIKKALNDDFNTGEMMANVFEVVRVFNSQNVVKKVKDANAKASCEAFLAWLKSWGDVCALFNEKAHVFLSEMNTILVREKEVDVEKVEKLIQTRSEARLNKDWTASDKARDALTAIGIEIQDGDSSRWTPRL